MCGIWFFIQPKKYNQINKNALHNACNEIQKRGPDRSISKTLTFGDFEIYISFHRLAIMDLSSLGDQPFYLQNDKGEEIYLICNGEIYGYKNLVKLYNLEDKLKSQSDCEILIHIYEKLGVKGLYDILTSRDDVSGEFAMIILHFTSNELQIHYLRDFCGKRPLYKAEYELDYESDNKKFNSLCLSSQLCGIPFPDYQFKKTTQVNSSTYGTYIVNSDTILHKNETTFDLRQIPITIYDEEEATEKIYNTFLRIIEDQMVSDREVAFMTSGGLDSSLCACVGAHILKSKGLQNKIKTISIGMEGGTDEKFAKIVAKHINSEHIHIMCTEEEFIKCAENDITYQIESYDITTNRASVPQFISAQKIKEQTNCKVVIVGDYADEVCGGYNETKYAPTTSDFAERIYELTEEIIYFDGQRVDRCVGGSGLEARLPFGDHRFIKLYLSIDPELRKPRNGCEKYLLRKAFDTKDMIPQEVLWRPKEAFSDGVSSVKKSWYKIVLDYFDSKYTDSEVLEASHFKINPPYTKESLHYRLKFNEKYSELQANVIPKFWLPKWGNVKEPSARVLDVYKSTE